MGSVAVTVNHGLSVRNQLPRRPHSPDRTTNLVLTLVRSENMATLAYTPLEEIDKVSSGAFCGNIMTNAPVRSTENYARDSILA